MRALLAVLVVITCTPVAFAQEGALVTVFWDRDGNGVRGEGELAYKRPEIAIRDDAGFDAVVRGGEDGTYRLPHAGRWQVSHDEDPFVTTTPTVVQSDGQDVVFGIRGASICGTVWLDADADGEIDEAESRIAGHRIAVEHYQWADREATTAPDGTYCLQDLPSGALTLQSGDRGGIDGTAWGYTAPDNPIIKTSSKFDWTSGRTRQVLIEPGAEITGYDSAFVQPKGMDVTARRVRIDNVRYDGIHVGDRLDVICEHEVMGNVPEMHRATLTLPEGLKILETRIIRDVPAKVDGQRVVRDNPTHLAPNEKSNLVAHVEVEWAFAGEEITCEALPGPLGDSTAENNVARLEIGVVGATSVVGSGTTPIWGGVLAVLLAGGGLFAVWRRRRRASPSHP